MGWADDSAQAPGEPPAKCA